MTTRGLSIRSRFMLHVNKRGDNDCWNWNGCTGNDNIGRFRVNNKTLVSHRFAFELFGNVKIGDDDIILHSCNNSLCCNPKHLFISSNVCYICGKSDYVNRHSKMCKRCSDKNNSKIRNGMLSKHSERGKGLIAEQIVCKFLNVDNLNIVNDNFNNDFDLFHDKFGRVDVKGSALLLKNDCRDERIYNYSYWYFSDLSKMKCDTFIFIGFDEKRKNVVKVWFIDSQILNIQESVSIYKSYKSLSRFRCYEVNAKPFNDILHELSKSECLYLFDV